MSEAAPIIAMGSIVRLIKSHSTDYVGYVSIEGEPQQLRFTPNSRYHVAQTDPLIFGSAIPKGPTCPLRGHKVIPVEYTPGAKKVGKWGVLPEEGARPNPADLRHLDDLNEGQLNYYLRGVLRIAWKYETDYGKLTSAAYKGRRLTLSYNLNKTGKHKTVILDLTGATLRKDGRNLYIEGITTRTGHCKIHLLRH